MGCRLCCKSWGALRGQQGRNRPCRQGECRCRRRNNTRTGENTCDKGQRTRAVIVPGNRAASQGLHVCGLGWSTKAGSPSAAGGAGPRRAPQGPSRARPQCFFQASCQQSGPLTSGRTRRSGQWSGRRRRSRRWSGRRRRSGRLQRGGGVGRGPCECKGWGWDALAAPPSAGVPHASGRPASQPQRSPGLWCTGLRQVGLLQGRGRKPPRSSRPVDSMLASRRGAPYTP